MPLQLIQPDTSYEESYCAYLEELGVEERYPYPMDLEHSDFPALVVKLTEYALGIGLPDWLVPNSTFWLVDEGEIVGVSHLRHFLNDELRKSGGHIGLGIRPGRRRKGMGDLLLKFTLAEARNLGIQDIHIHCHKVNMASVRLIKSANALLDSEIAEEASDRIIQRFIVPAP